MSRDPQLRLLDIKEAGEAVRNYIEGYTFDAFVKDRKTVDAVARNLEIIGEAVKHLPEELTDQAFLPHDGLPREFFTGGRRGSRGFPTGFPAVFLNRRGRKDHRGLPTASVLKSSRPSRP